MKSSTSKITRITLVRHGTTLWMEQGIMHGRTDAQLSEHGILEVEKTAAALRARVFDAFYTSPTGRAMQTAQIIGKAIQMQPLPLDGLLEHNFGVMEGTVNSWTPSRIRAIKVMIFGWMISPWKSGESFSQIHYRVKMTLKEILSRHSGCRVLIVTHHGVINVILHLLSKQYFTFFRIAPAMVIELEIDENCRGKILSNVPTL